MIRRNKGVRTTAIRSLDPKRALLIKQALIGCGLATVLTMLLTGVWYGSRLDVVTIDQINVHGGDTVSHEHITQTVEALLQDTYFHLIPKRFSYLYPEAAIREALSDIDRVDDVFVDRINRQTIAVTFTEHLPFALWCSEDGERCMFINAEGYAFTVAPDLVGGTLLRLYDSRREPQVGSVAATREQVADISFLVTAIENEVGWGAERVMLEADERLTIHTINNAELYIQLSQPVTHTLHYLQSLLRAENYAHLQEQEFAYIDLRFGNRVFINETRVAGAATSTSSINPTANVDTTEDATVTPSGADPVVPDEVVEPVSTQDADVTQTQVVEPAAPGAGVISNSERDVVGTTTEDTE